MSVATSADISWLTPPPLVIRSSEGVLLGEWPCTWSPWHRQMSTGQGWHFWIYTLMDHEDQVCYVGQTGSLRSRLNHHGRKRFAWWYAFGTNDWRRDEAAQIDACDPYLFSDGRMRCDPARSRVITRDEILAGGGR